MSRQRSDDKVDKSDEEQSAVKVAIVVFTNFVELFSAPGFWLDLSVGLSMLSCCFLWQETLLHIVSFYPGVQTGYPVRHEVTNLLGGDSVTD